MASPLAISYAYLSVSDLGYRQLVGSLEENNNQLLLLVVSTTRPQCLPPAI